MVEFALAVTVVLLLICVAIDFGRVMNDMQVMAELTRQGSNLASRYNTLPVAVSALASGTSGLNLASYGEIIITSVENCATATATNPTYSMTGQAFCSKTGTSSCGSQLGTTPASKVGTWSTVTVVGSGSLKGCPTVLTKNKASLPSAYPTTGNTNLPLQSGQTVYVTEIYFQFTPITPVSTLALGAISMPSMIYDAAFF
jgi:Flp pilus assembly protein TadG